MMTKQNENTELIQINQIKIAVYENGESESIKDRISRLFSVTKNDFELKKILKKSLDARKKPDIFWIYSVVILVHEPKIMKKFYKTRTKCQVQPFLDNPYSFPDISGKHTERPVIVGTGPAGLFCGYMLALQGLKPILLERGLPVEERTKAVNQFWCEGKLNPDCNVQFGEGGAGTFSDGKLQTQVNDKYGRIRKVLEIFVAFGAPEEILYLNKPHIGTDILSKVIYNMRKKMEELGAEFLFSTTFLKPMYRENQIKGILIKKSEDTLEELACSCCILAIGHSARDTFEMLVKENISMENKAFAVGYRVQHPQEIINSAQYGVGAYSLPAADYKLTYQAASERGIYSFCMCPGGYVVNASSENGYTAVNGMSYHSRNSGVANSAIVITVTPNEYGGQLLDGMRFQRELEKRAFEIGSGKLVLQRFGDFVQNVPSSAGNHMEPKIKGLYRYGNCRSILPDDLNSDIIEAMHDFGRKIPGFDDDSDVLFCGAESRTSSPVRILRNDRMESSLQGLFPCGEGAGYAGGITSAAVDGLKVAEKVALLYNQA